MDKLTTYRQAIDKIDEQLLVLFAKRNALVRQIGIVKREQTLPVGDKNREKQKLTSLANSAEKYKISKDFVKTVWNAVFKLSYNLQGE